MNETAYLWLRLGCGHLQQALSGNVLDLLDNTRNMTCDRCQGTSGIPTRPKPVPWRERAKQLKALDYHAEVGNR